MAAAREPALRILQRNDPATTSVNIFLHEESDDPALSQALWAHDGVTEVYVSLTGSSGPGPNNNQGWSSLRRVLATKSRLQKISLLGICPAGNEQVRPPNEIVRLFMECVQQNNAVKRLNLIHLHLPGPETVALVEDMSSLTEFSVYACSIQAAHGGDEESSTRIKEKGALAIAKALQKNQTIEQLVFAPTLAEPCMLSIVQGLLVSNKHLQTLHMCLEVHPLDSSININRYETMIAACLDAVSQCQNLRAVGRFYVENESSFQALCRGIPHLQIRHVKIDLRNPVTVNAENRIYLLLKALQRNYKLLSASVTDENNDTSILDDATTVQVSRYLLRNKGLAEWVAHPESVPKHLWPEALALAQQAGEETLWQSLLKVGPEVSNHGKRKRKRKRTRFYDPSL